MTYLNLEKVPQSVLDVLSRLAGEGHEAVLVGGAVRDIIHGVNPHDFDVATSATPEQVMKCFKRCIPTGIKHGTVTVVLDRLLDFQDVFGPETVEITTFRSDGAYTDGRRPDGVKFVTSLTEDLSRRDFTINAMAMRHDGELVDPFGGMPDLLRKELRTVGDADARFAEDGLRVVRAARFVATMNMKAAPGLEEAMNKAAPTVSKVAVERFTNELTKILSKARCSPSVGLRMLHRTKILELFIPAFACDEAWGNFDAVDTSAIDRASTLPVRLSILFMEFGRFSAEHIMTDLKMPTKLIEEVSTLLRAVAFIVDNDGENMPHVIRKAVRLIGEHRRGDLREILTCAFIAGPTMVAKVEDAMAEGFVPSVRDLDLTGEDLKAAGFAGKDIGDAQKRLLHLCDLQPELNKKDLLLGFLSLGKDA